MIGPKKFECVVFDLDGVLVDSSSQHAQAFQELWAKVGIDGPDYADIAGLRSIDVIKKYIKGEQMDATRVDEWVEFKQRRARELLVGAEILFSDSREALERIIRMTSSMAIATGASTVMAQYAAQQLAPSRPFDAIVAAEDVSRSKPNPEVFEKAIKRCGATPGKSLIIEDGAAGLAAALGSRAFVASVRSGLELHSERFLGRFESLDDLLRHLSERSH
ncbi:MAG: HAD family phosphatase [Proteobacteria bacterium]|jgi:beta-phosphoglucomutase|nr:HAD family phosphatase [Pseudomonadota bacterium]